MIRTKSPDASYDLVWYWMLGQFAISLTILGIYLPMWSFFQSRKLPYLPGYLGSSPCCCGNVHTMAFLADVNCPFQEGLLYKYEDKDVICHQHAGGINMTTLNPKSTPTPIVKGRCEDILANCHSFRALHNSTQAWLESLSDLRPCPPLGDIFRPKIPPRININRTLPRLSFDFLHPFIPQT